MGPLQWRAYEGQNSSQTPIQRQSEIEGRGGSSEKNENEDFGKLQDCSAIK